MKDPNLRVLVPHADILAANNRLDELEAALTACRADNERLNALTHKLMDRLGDEKFALLDSVYEAGYQAGYEKRNQDDPPSAALAAARDAYVRGYNDGLHGVHPSHSGNWEDRK